MENISYNIFNSLVSRNYDLVIDIDANVGQFNILHTGKLMIDKKIDTSAIKDYTELCRVFAEQLVVEDERECFIVDGHIDVVLSEINSKGIYVRTLHVKAGNRIQAEGLRVVKVSENRYLLSLINVNTFLERDWMTDEYSRVGFMVKAEELFKEEEYQQGYSMVYTNIKGFKAMNDLLGTFSGDMIIFMLRDILVRELKPVLLARLESDHFALITKTEYLTEEKFEQMCPQVYEEGFKRLPFTIRCGVYRIYDATKTIQHMIDRAKLAEKTIQNDHAVSYAFCNDKISADYMTRRKLISEVDVALERNEFKAYYQPVVDAKTGEIVSAEALIRWVHPTRGMVSPGQFVPAFEEEGLITQTDKFMIDSVIKFNAERMAQGKRVVPCAVNLSRVDFYNTKLMDSIGETFDLNDSVEDIIKFEVTESAYAELEKTAMLFLGQMVARGVSLMLDDFGSGMSSFSTLESFAFDVVKLDMGFISKIGESAKAEAIIKHVIGLSHDIGAKVVAEGVETQAQLEFLREADCDMIQGYYFYRPMPEEEFAALL